MKRFPPIAFRAFSCCLAAVLATTSVFGAEPPQAVATAAPQATPEAQAKPDAQAKPEMQAAPETQVAPEAQATLDAQSSKAPQPPDAPSRLGASPTENGQAVGTAAAPAVPAEGVPASRPAGTAIAPAKQRRAHSYAVRVALILGIAVAVGVVTGATLASSSRPH